MWIECENVHILFTDLTGLMYELIVKRDTELGINLTFASLGNGEDIREPVQVHRC